MTSTTPADRIAAAQHYAGNALRNAVIDVLGKSHYLGGSPASRAQAAASETSRGRAEIGRIIGDAMRVEIAELERLRCAVSTWLAEAINFGGDGATDGDMLALREWIEGGMPGDPPSSSGADRERSLSAPDATLGRCGATYSVRIPDFPADQWETSECIQVHADAAAIIHDDGEGTRWAELAE